MSETMQSDPGDECDAAACSCGPAAEVGIPTADRDGHALRDRRRPVDAPTESDLVTGLRAVLDRNRAAYRRAVDRWHAQHPAVQPEERKP